MRIAVLKESMSSRILGGLDPGIYDAQVTALTLNTDNLVVAWEVITREAIRSYKAQVRAAGLVLPDGHWSREYFPE